MSDPTQKNEPQKNESPKQGNARIPVKKIWFRETLDLPGGNSILDHIECAPQTHPGRQFFVAHFVPAHQVIELEWWKNEKLEPYRTRVPLAFVKRFD